MKTILDRYAFHIVFVVFAAIAVTFGVNYKTARDDSRRAETEVFAPYFDAIGDERFAEAWAFHSDDWRQRHPEAEFTGFYRKLLADEGPVVSQNVWGSRRAGLPFVGSPGIIVDYQLGLKAAFYAITYTLVPTSDGRLLIDAGVSTSGNMRLVSRPW